LRLLHFKFEWTKSPIKGNFIHENMSSPSFHVGHVPLVFYIQHAKLMNQMTRFTRFRPINIYFSICILLDMQPALDLNLMARIVDSANILQAWKRVKSNQGAPGSDGMSLDEFPDYAREHWLRIRQSLLDGTYPPSSMRRVVIAKPHGKGDRLLGVPCVLDRVIQQAILQVLSPIFEPKFSDSSYGSRPKRSAHGVI
jgi:hypothetical protein